MEEVLMTRINNLEFAIFDFDGTLVNLDVNWNRLRRQLDVNSIEDIWSLSFKEQNMAWETVSKVEIESVSRSRQNTTLISLLDQLDYSVLTNNCEDAVEEFLSFNRIQNRPKAIVGRNWLGKSKTDVVRFSEAVAHLLVTSNSHHHHEESQLGYFGDSDYELEYSLCLGLDTFKVAKDGSIEPFGGKS
jgi:FMN phosphatase YigB (HAD superfamily)